MIIPIATSIATPMDSNGLQIRPARSCELFPHSPAAFGRTEEARVSNYASRSEIWDFRLLVCPERRENLHEGLGQGEREKNMKNSHIFIRELLSSVYKQSRRGEDPLESLRKSLSS